MGEDTQEAMALLEGEAAHRALPRPEDRGPIDTIK